MDDQDGYIRNQDVRIYYKIEGSGSPLIMLHGNGEDHHRFDVVKRYFNSNYKVIRIDSRGHGLSDRGKEKFTTKLMAEDVLALMDQLSIPKAIIFGFSDGANIGLEMAVKRPEKISALIAISGNIEPRGIRTLPYFFIRLQYYWFSFLEKLKLPVGNKAWFYGLMCISPQLTKEELNRIKSPVLILVGTKDLIKTQHAKKMGEWIPKSRVVILKGVRHFSLFREPERYMKRLVNFLKSNDL